MTEALVESPIVEAIVKFSDADQLAFAMEFDNSTLKSLMDKFDDAKLKTLGAPGACTLRSCRQCFRSIDKKVYDWLVANDIPMKSFYSAAASYMVECGNICTISQARSMLRVLWKSRDNLKRICSYMLKKKGEMTKHKEVIRSILLSVQRLCNLTFDKERVARPSVILDSIIDSGSLGRYLGGTLSYHFMALVPDIETRIKEHASTRVDIRNTREKVMDDDFSVFYDDLPKYKYEATQACKCLIGNPINIKGILPFTDEYYYNTYLPSKSNNVENTHIH